MKQHSIEGLKTKMQAVKDIYAQLFSLMLDSASQNGDAPAADPANSPLDGLLAASTEALRDFMSDVHDARADRAIPEELDGEIIHFEGELKNGLTAMNSIFQKRMGELRKEHENLKGKLKLVQRKRTGVKGYGKGFIAGALAQSRPMQTNA